MESEEQGSSSEDALGSGLPSDGLPSDHAAPVGEASGDVTDLPSDADTWTSRDVSPVGSALSSTRTDAAEPEHELEVAQPEVTSRPRRRRGRVVAPAGPPRLSSAEVGGTVGAVRDSGGEQQGHPGAAPDSQTGATPEAP